MPLDTGISMSRYLPAIGTAGLLRDFVSGNNRVPRPPPRISEMTRGIAPLPSRSKRVGPAGPAEHPRDSAHGASCDTSGQSRPAHPPFPTVHQPRTMLDSITFHAPSTPL